MGWDNSQWAGNGLPMQILTKQRRWLLVCTGLTQGGTACILTWRRIVLTFLSSTIFSRPWRGMTLGCLQQHRTTFFLTTWFLRFLHGGKNLAIVFRQFFLQETHTPLRRSLIRDIDIWVTVKLLSGSIKHGDQALQLKLLKIWAACVKKTEKLCKEHPFPETSTFRDVIFQIPEPPCSIQTICCGFCHIIYWPVQMSISKERHSVCARSLLGKQFAGYR